MTRPSKRIALRTAALAGIAAVALAACSGQDGANSSGGGTVDPNGVLTYGMSLVTGAGSHFDPTISRAEAVDLLPMQMVYGTLLRAGDNGTLQPWMAKDVRIVDPKTVNITLRPGVKFSDGSSYDATAVKTSMMRLHTQATPAALDQLAGFQSLASLDVVDPLTVVAHLNQPLAAVFEAALAGEPGAIQSPKQIAEDPGAIETKPIGAGPYKLTAFQPQQIISFRKNPDFWDAGSWKLGGLDIVNTAAGAPMANGLIAGTVDMANQVPPPSVNSLKNGNFATHVVSNNLVELMLCPTKPPLDNEAVRQAIQSGIDRQAFNTLLYAGLGQPAYSLVQEGSPYFDPKIKDIVGYNPDKAKQLLASSGTPNVSLDVYLVASNNFGQQAEVLQQQLGKIGVNVQVHTELNIYNGWIAAQKPGALLTYLVGTEPGSYTLFQRFFQKGGSYAYCGSSAPEVMNLVNQAAALPPNDPQAVANYRQAALLVAQHAYAIPILLNPTVFGWNTSRVGGTPTFTSTDGIPLPRLDSLYIKK